jgi:hypothetical protein
MQYDDSSTICYPFISPNYAILTLSHHHELTSFCKNHRYIVLHMKTIVDISKNITLYQTFVEST